MIRTQEQVMLLKCIAENPEDDTRRLGYADYLDEMCDGDNFHSEYIRTAIKLATGEPSGKGFGAIVEWRELGYRADKLLGENSKTWMYGENFCPTCNGRGLVQKEEPKEKRYVSVNNADDPEQIFNCILIEELCPTCLASKSLLRLRDNLTEPISYRYHGPLELNHNRNDVYTCRPRDIKWYKGFPSSVLCHPLEILDYKECKISANGNIRELVKHYPVTKLMMLDFIPINGYRTKFEWRGSNTEPVIGLQGYVPYWLIGHMLKISAQVSILSNSSRVAYNRLQDAIDHLATTIGNLVREDVFGS